MNRISPPAEEPAQTACPEGAAGSGWILTRAPDATQSGCWQHTRYLAWERQEEETALEWLIQNSSVLIGRYHDQHHHHHHERKKKLEMWQMQQITHEVILGKLCSASLKNRANVHYGICNLIKTRNVSHYNIKVWHDGVESLFAHNKKTQHYPFISALFE